MANNVELQALLTEDARSDFVSCPSDYEHITSRTVDNGIRECMQNSCFPFRHSKNIFHTAFSSSGLVRVDIVNCAIASSSLQEASLHSNSSSLVRPCSPMSMQNNRDFRELNTICCCLQLQAILYVLCGLHSLNLLPRKPSRLAHNILRELHVSDYSHLAPRSISYTAQ